MDVFDGPQITPPRISLLTSAELITPTTERWYNGFFLQNEGCEDSGVYLVCPAADADPKDYTAGGVNEEYQPWVLYSTYRCSTYPSGHDFYGRAERKLLAAEAAVLENQLWAGTVQTGNPYLADTPTTIPLTATSAKDAFAVLEQELGELSAARGMIHVRPQVLHALLEAQVVRREGNVYLSPMDNFVVPGRGYPGTGPASEAVGATEWMYAHPSIVQVRRGPIIRLGENDLASQVIRDTNDRLVTVERAVHVALDTSCGVLAIEFNSVS
jgi:hypothetical protein